MYRVATVDEAVSIAFERIKRLAPAAFVAFGYALGIFFAPPALAQVLYNPSGAGLAALIVGALALNVTWDGRMTLTAGGGLALYLAADMVAVSASRLLWGTGLYLIGYASLSATASLLDQKRLR